MRLPVFLLLLFNAINFTFSQSTPQVTMGPTTHAIIIGVSDYPMNQDLKPLKYADDDAKLVEQFLSIQKNVIIHKLVNNEASTAKIVGQEIKSTLVEAKPNDHVLIYFSGHGDSDDSDGFLLLSEVYPASDHDYRNNDALQLSNIALYIKAANARGVKTTLIIDACKSGQAVYKVGGLNNTIVMASSQSGVNSMESADYKTLDSPGHGAFTYYLIQGLMGLADNPLNVDDIGIITFSEIKSYVEDEMAKDLLLQNNSQEPKFDYNGSSKTKLFSVNEEFLKTAKSNQSKKLSIGSMDFASRGVDGQIFSLSNITNNLIDLLIQLSNQSIFFPDEIEQVKKNSLVLKENKTSKNHKTVIWDIATSINGKFTATCSEDGLALYENASISPTTKLIGHKSGVLCVDFSKNSELLASGGWDNSVYIWDCIKKTKVNQSGVLKSNITSLNFQSNDQLLVGLESGELVIWNISSGNKETIKANSARINDIEIYNNKIYTAGDDGYIVEYDITTKKSQKYKAHSNGAKDICFLNMSNAILSVGYDGKLKKWDLNSLKLISEIDLGYNSLNCVDVDQFEQFCFVASKKYRMDIVNLGNNAVTNDYVTSQRGISCMLYDDVNKCLNFGDYGGAFSRNYIEINPNLYSAIDVHQQLLKSPDAKDYAYRIDGTLISGLNTQISKVLDKLVNGDADVPSLDDVLKVKRYAEKALEIGSKYEFDAPKLKINLRLLEIFEILMQNQSDKYQEALTKIKEIESIDPNGAYVYNIAGVLYARLDQMDQAKEKANSAEKLAPLWAEAPCGTGKIFFQEGDFNSAEIKFKETIQKAPDLSKGYYNLGKLYMVMGDLENAKSNLEKALKIDPEIDLIQAANAEVQFKSGNSEKSISIARSIDENSINPSVITTKTDILCLNDKKSVDYLHLQTLYKKAIELDSNNSMSWTSLGYFYLRLLDDKNAAAFIEKSFPATKQNNATKTLRLECKEIFSTAKKLDKKNIKAQIGYWLSLPTDVDPSSIKSLLGNSNESAEAYYHIGRYYERKNLHKDALSYYKKAYTKNKQYVVAYFAAMDCNSKLGKGNKNAGIEQLMLKNGIKKEVMSFKNEILQWESLY